jgi:hypothetical protein
MMSSISLVITENTPIQNIWIHPIPHTSWAGCRR